MENVLYKLPLKYDINICNGMKVHMHYILPGEQTYENVVMYIMLSRYPTGPPLDVGGVDNDSCKDMESR